MANPYIGYFAISKRIKQEQGIAIDRAELLSRFTDGQKESLKDLTSEEYKDFLKWLNDCFQLKTAKSFPDTPENRMRKKIISILRKIGYEKQGKADMKRIYTWVKQYGGQDKPFNKYTNKELQKLIAIAESRYKKDIQ